MKDARQGAVERLAKSPIEEGARMLAQELWRTPKSKPLDEPFGPAAAPLRAASRLLVLPTRA